MNMKDKCQGTPVRTYIVWFVVNYQLEIRVSDLMHYGGGFVRGEGPIALISISLSRESRQQQV